MSNNPWFVLVLGMGTVFVGLICLIYLTKLLSLVVRATSGKKKLNEQAAPAGPAPVQPVAVQAAHDPAVERRQFVAAVSAAVASYLGTDIEGLRIHSITAVPNDGTLAERAAAQAAIAVTMRRDPNAIRIYSMRRV